MLGKLVSIGFAKDRIVFVPCPPSDPQTWKKAWEERDRIELKTLPKTNEINRVYYEAGINKAREMGITKVHLHSFRRTCNAQCMRIAVAGG